MATGSDAGPHDTVPWSVDELAAVLDLVPSSVGVWSSDLRNEYLNAASYDSLALDEDAHGKALLDVVGRASYDRAIEWIRRAQAGERQRFMRVIRRADGREEHYDIEYVPIPSEDSRSVSIIAIGVDVSAQVTADILRRGIAPFLATVHERERLASELEDTLTAALEELTHDLLAAVERIPSLAPALSRAAALTDTAGEQLRGLLHKRNRVGAGLQFSTAAEGVIDEAAAVLGFTPAFALRGPVERMRPLLADDVLAVLGEGLLNVARHAGATEVVVAVSVTSNQVSVTVADNGRGLGGAPPGGGMGNLAARAARLGGVCEWRDRETSGTLLEWRIPLDGPLAGSDSGPDVGPGRRLNPVPLDLPVATRFGRVSDRPVGLSARRLLLVLDELPSVIVVWDAEQRLEFANAAGVAWFEAGSRAEVIGQPMADLLAPGAYYATQPFVRAALNGETQQFERSVDDGSEPPTDIRVIYTPRVVDGAVVGVVAQIFDISDRMAAQDDVQRSMHEMITLEERRRIAEDLHDIVIQHLFAAGLQLKAALDAIGTDSAGTDSADADDSVTLLQESIERVDNAIARLRESIATLRENPPHPGSSPG